jgi:hypothetical protein
MSSDSFPSKVTGVTCLSRARSGTRHLVVAYGNTLSVHFEAVGLEVTPPTEAHLLGLAAMWYRWYFVPVMDATPRASFVPCSIDR